MARVSEDRIGPVLSAQARRVVRALLDDASIDADPIVGEGETLEREAYVTACYELHHVILPELEDGDFVEFDRVADRVTRGPGFDEVRALFEGGEDGRGLFGGSEGSLDVASKGGRVDEDGSE